MFSRRVAFLAGSAVLAVAAAACSSGGSGSSVPSSSAAAAAVPGAVTTTLNKYLAVPVFTPPGPPVDAAKLGGKRVFVILITETQEELAEAARLSLRSVSDLERGVNRTAHKTTALLLADALDLAGPARELFVAAARGRGPSADVLAAREGGLPGAFAAAATRTLPRDIASFTGRQAELAQLLGALAAAAAGGGGLAGIHAIGGMAGVGRTVFGVHAAHRLAGSFPDGLRCPAAFTCGWAGAAGMVGVAVRA